MAARLRVDFSAIGLIDSSHTSRLSSLVTREIFEPLREYFSDNTPSKIVIIYSTNPRDRAPVVIGPCSINTTYSIVLINHARLCQLLDG